MKLKALVVDDSRVMRRMVMQALEQSASKVFSQSLLDYLN